MSVHAQIHLSERDWALAKQSGSAHSTVWVKLGEDATVFPDSAEQCELVAAQFLSAAELLRERDKRWAAERALSS